MKKILFIIILNFFFITASQADDISDFQIEGFSVGDNLFDHLKTLGRTKQSIKNQKHFYFPSSKKFAGLVFDTTIQLDTYESIQFVINPKTYEIVNVDGTIKKGFNNNIQKCYKKMEEIYSELKNNFPNATEIRGKEKKHAYNNNSLSKKHELLLNNGRMSVRCTDWAKETNIKDGLVVSVGSDKYHSWLNKEAYK